MGWSTVVSLQLNRCAFGVVRDLACKAFIYASAERNFEIPLKVDAIGIETLQIVED